jgi:hypothetical protein
MIVAHRTLGYTSWLPLGLLAQDACTHLFWLQHLGQTVFVLGCHGLPISGVVSVARLGLCVPVLAAAFLLTKIFL